MRLTKGVRTQLLLQNDGFSTRSSYDSRNSEYERIYTIKDGRSHIREISKTSWSDSRYDKKWYADAEEIHRFLYNNLWKLNTADLE